MTLDYRYEIKFVLDDTKLSEAMQWLYNDTTANKTYNDRRVNSIYFDDVDFIIEAYLELKSPGKSNSKNFAEVP